MRINKWDQDEHLSLPQIQEHYSSMPPALLPSILAIYSILAKYSTILSTSFKVVTQIKEHE